jgi:hypothetical protein
MEEKQDLAAARALPVGVGPMRLITAAEVSANAARRWREQYADWSDEDRFADGTTKGDVNAALNRLTRHTPENISGVLNAGWAHPKCDCCRQNVTQAVQFIGWDDREIQTLCHACLSAAASLSEP